MRKICLLVVGILVVAVKGGEFPVKAEEQSLIPSGVRTIYAIRATVPPVIDGKLEDTCWQEAKPVTDFPSIDSDRLVSYQSIAYICYDESNLYIGVKCIMPKGTILAGKLKPHDSYFGLDDVIEIMIDPGRSLSNYYQLVVSAYGNTFDTYRKMGGAQHDPAWNGDWTSAAHIGDSYWSMEMSVPFYTLDMSSEVGSTWGINICRETKKPTDEYSSISARGTFNNANNFAILKDLNVDFKKYLFQVGPDSIHLESTESHLRALLGVPIKNITGKTKDIKMERYADNNEILESKVVTLKHGEETTFSPEPLEVEPLDSNRTDAYIILSVPKTKKLVISDAKDGTVLANSFVNRHRFFEAMKVEVQNPWQKDLLPEKSKVVYLKVHTFLSKKQLENGELLVTLTSKEDGKALASKSFSGPSETTEVAFSTGDIPWGAYDARAVFKDSRGQEIVSSHALATVLPGGKQYIKVLNNLVSELMNAKERGLVGKKKIEFMNPRDGWVFFSISGEGSAIINSESKPVAVVKAGEEAVEAMRRIPPGKHILRIAGNLDQIIIRAVPELIYHGHPLGRSWESLRKDVRPNSNVILEDTTDKTAMREWTSAGKKWMGLTIAPSHELVGGTVIPADAYYEQLLEDERFKDPLLSGVMVDMIGGAKPEQKLEIAKTLSKIAANPELKGKEYRPWFEGQISATEVDMTYMNVVLEAGWPFVFYVYPTEKPTEELAKNLIRDTIVRNALSCNAWIPGSIRRAIVTLGYTSSPRLGMSQDIDPNVDFKVLMQMMIETLAKEPAFFGLYGTSWEYSAYVEEEILRWAGQLFRHYAIEGKTTKLTTEPYRLTHIENPEFEEGTKGWTIMEAESGKVSVPTLISYGKLQNRYLGGSAGDTFLLTKRSAKGPNKFSQEIKDLTPGRAYSMKMITADYRNIIEEKSVMEKNAVSIKFDNVEMITGPRTSDEIEIGKNTQETFPNSYGASRGKFTGSRTYPNPPGPGEYNAYMNYHWYVFRAKGNKAKLTISDWGTDNAPGGPIGQEIMYNFIEIRPYLED